MKKLFSAVLALIVMSLAVFADDKQDAAQQAATTLLLAQYSDDFCPCTNQPYSEANGVSQYTSTPYVLHLLGYANLYATRCDGNSHKVVRALAGC